MWEEIRCACPKGQADWEQKERKSGTFFAWYACKKCKTIARVVCLGYGLKDFKGDESLIPLWNLIDALYFLSGKASSILFDEAEIEENRVEMRSGPAGSYFCEIDYCRKYYDGNYSVRIITGKKSFFEKLIKETFCNSTGNRILTIARIVKDSERHCGNKAVSLWEVLRPYLIQKAKEDNDGIDWEGFFSTHLLKWEEWRKQEDLFRGREIDDLNIISSLKYAEFAYFRDLGPDTHYLETKVGRGLVIRETVFW